MDHKLIGRIEEYTELMNDTYGEGLEALMYIYRQPHLFSDEFNKNVEKELKDQYVRLTTEFRIEERECMPPPTPRKYKEVVWLGDVDD